MPVTHDHISILISVTLDHISIHTLDAFFVQGGIKNLSEKPHFMALAGTGSVKSQPGSFPNITSHHVPVTRRLWDRT